MIARKPLAVSALTLAIVAGCIVSDQVSTLTIRPDGSADWVKFQSNIRSTDSGAKGAEELREFVDRFNAHENADYKRIVAVGGEVIEARWLRKEEPYSNVIVARFSSAKVLEDFCTLQGKAGEWSTRARFTENGRRRRFSVVVSPPGSATGKAPQERTISQFRQQQANGISESRVVVVGGRILDSRGFTVADDRRSALLDPLQLEELLQRGTGEMELFLEWELTGE